MISGETTPLDFSSIASSHPNHHCHCTDLSLRHLMSMANECVAGHQFTFLERNAS
jgi:hypothetical protein